MIKTKIITEHIIISNETNECINFNFFLFLLVFNKPPLIISRIIKATKKTIKSLPPNFTTLKSANLNTIKPSNIEAAIDMNL